MSNQISCVFHYNACACREAQTARLIREMNDAIRERSARITALESDLATARADRDVLAANVRAWRSWASAFKKWMVDRTEWNDTALKEAARILDTGLEDERLTGALDRATGGGA